MAKLKNGRMPAHPVHPDLEREVVKEKWCWGGTGLTKREELAKAAMAGLAANPVLHDQRTMIQTGSNIFAATGRGGLSPGEIVAILAVEYADALLAELARHAVGES